MAILLRETLKAQILTSRVLERATERVAKAKFNEAKDAMMDEFNEHPVTQEIEEGPDAANISGTLPGGYGNLTSFIGFEANREPTEEVREILEENTRFVVGTTNKTYESGHVIKYKYKVYLPTPLALEQSKMEWENRGWAMAIEEGISGFSSYLYDTEHGFSTSRSSTAIQAKTERGKGVPVDLSKNGNHPAGDFKTIPYMTVIFNHFKRFLTSK